MFSSKLEAIYKDNLGDIAEEMARELSKIEPKSGDPIGDAVARSQLATSQFKVEISEEAYSLFDQWNSSDYADDYIQESYGLLNVLTVDEINIPGGYDMMSALELIKSLYLSMGSVFYGAVMLEVGAGSSNMRFNPLHPLIAAKIEYMLSHNMLDNKKYKVIVYTANSFSGYSAMQYMKDSIVKLILAATKTIGQQVVRQNFQRNGDLLTYTESTSAGTGSDMPGVEHFSIIPSHLCGYNGLVYPYYGSVMIKRFETGGVGGKQLSPMLNANIATPYEDEWTSVCTGDTSSSTDEGLQTLNHSNYDSPMNSQTWNSECYSYALSCIESSLEIFFGDFKKEEQDEQKRSSEQTEEETTTTEGESNELPLHIHEEGTSDRGGDREASRSIADDTAVDSGLPEEEWDEWSL